MQAASQETPVPPISQSSLDLFSAHLLSSNKILALLGAGLSVPSNISAFRGSTDVFRGCDMSMLSSNSMFRDDPVLTWWYHVHRREQVLRAKPNIAHYALSKLGDCKIEYLAITQNIDGLSEKAGHKASCLQPIHGSILNFKCSAPNCPYTLLHKDQSEMLGQSIVIPPNIDLANANVPLPTTNLPHCPDCNSFLRPDITWFGEELNAEYLHRIDKFIAQGPVDLMLVVGTQASVHPAASYILKARKAGARIAYVDIKPWCEDKAPLGDRDFFFQGDAVDVVPMILRDVIGEVKC
ncbi:DHS-like NAD/FAD-binding domain-containing protein [Microthyrium microscopicum]|uniref:DHS-like NAD/FAD-binding domain-containing protein n=1 Tax=Microthyrium microscopicum TaxID=703497 RepID=A0A6A6U043_9PEZI|nr:DHS-like NAD/FAD-binding domain-containing protein [Microthyrium microscopicum]